MENFSLPASALPPHPQPISSCKVIQVGCVTCQVQILLLRVFLEVTAVLGVRRVPEPAQMWQWEHWAGSGVMLAPACSTGGLLGIVVVLDT